MGTLSVEASGLRELFARLVTRKVANWTDSNTENSALPVEAQMGGDANIVTSRWNDDQARHALLLDIDYPAYLVKSSTPGHYHLYLDVPGGIPHFRYVTLLESLADAGVIERGYERTSRLRGYSSLRLPWVKKGEP